ncbi:MAG TPA: acyl-homoserine-lactone synthase [Polymorphobacter sp.]|jgi:N-acyl-L-homoserine lactone synthetase|nr:acyl-homoserine-lactone synthase [Polymorphobacter sp.]
MATVVTHSNRRSHAACLAGMHADRKRVFVDTLHWELPVVDGCYEIDEYDTDDAIYLIVQDAARGDHLGSVRIVPTTGPHLLGDKFAFLCEGPVPTGLDVWEITRLCTAPGLPRATAARVREQLALALVEYALVAGIGRYTMMTHMALLAGVLATGWDCEPLGLPADVNGDMVGALLVTINPATLAKLRSQWSFSQPVLRLDLNESKLAA